MRTRIYTLSVFLCFLNSFLFGQITDIKAFLNQCPTSDPAYSVIRKDFEIRLNGIKVTEIPCTEPVSAMNSANYTNPLIYLQTLRVIYYMDRAMSLPHLPWTSLSLYDWMKSKVNGINIREGVSGGYCCENLDGKIFFVAGNQDEQNREFDKKWAGISGNVDFFAHEVRHRDGNGYYHSSCCGIPGGCDDEYNENDLGAYGIQYWLNKSWLTGFIYVGARTSYSDTEINELINWHLSGLNSQYNLRFCKNIPELINLKDIPTPLGPKLTDDQQIALFKLKVFPNPLRRGTVLRLTSPEQIIKVEIYTIGGIKLETQQSVTGGEMTVSILNLKPNLYILKVYTRKTGVFYQKLMVE